MPYAVRPPSVRIILSAHLARARSETIPYSYGTVADRARDELQYYGSTVLICSYSTVLVRVLVRSIGNPRKGRRRVEYAPRNTSRTELATISIRYSYTPYFNP